MKPPFNSSKCEVREDGMGWVTRPIKTVGKVYPMTPSTALRWNSSMLKLSPLCGKWFKPGVYKFKTWEEEAEWTRQQIKMASLRLK
jgi:hypothetical protein